MLMASLRRHSAAAPAYPPEPVTYDLPMGFRALEHYAQTRGLAPTGLVPEEQNTDYEADCVKLDDEWWQVRTARITPTKPGAFFVTWRRSPAGNTEPFSADDDCVGLLVFVSDGDRFGDFRFPSTALVELGIYSYRRSTGNVVFPSTRLSPPP